MWRPFGWRKPKPLPIPQVIKITCNKEQTLELYGLVDRYRATNALVDRFALWKRIEEMFPEVGEDSWLIDTRRAHHAIIKRTV